MCDRDGRQPREERVLGCRKPFAHLGGLVGVLSGDRGAEFRELVGRGELRKRSAVSKARVERTQPRMGIAGEHRRRTAFYLSNMTLASQRYESRPAQANPCELKIVRERRRPERTGRGGRGVYLDARAPDGVQRLMHLAVRMRFAYQNAAEAS
jgi:hypothetical protein